jgi:hypothetical protein
MHIPWSLIGAGLSISTFSFLIYTLLMISWSPKQIIHQQALVIAILMYIKAKCCDFFYCYLFIYLFYCLFGNHSHGYNFFFFWNYSLPKLSSTFIGPVIYASSSSRPYSLDLPRIQLVAIIHHLFLSWSFTVLSQYIKYDGLVVIFHKRQEAQTRKLDVFREVVWSVFVTHTSLSTDLQWGHHQ